MKIQLRSSELSTLLDQAPPGVRWLSLDCFDTLVWRDTATPADVFADLDFPGGAIEPRRRAEDAARAWAKLYRDSFEVSLDDIHERLRPGGDVAASVEAELAAEARHCFGFEPVKQLIRDAKARGLGVMIVSDTYLDEAQLRALIATAAGADIAALIDRVFPSSAYGMNKSDGLFGPVLEALGAAPGELLHVGDNPVADQVAPSELGINTVHLLQFDDAARARLRLEAAASAMIQPDVRVTRPAWQPHRPLVSLREESDPAFALGHDVLGPLLQTYAHWLHEERRAIAERSGRRTHLLFLLRDGFLPGRVFEELFADEPARLVEISRHTAAGASLVDEAAVRARLFHEGKYISVGMLAGQFHFKQGELAKLKLDELADNPEFVATVQRPEMLRQIVHRSARFADRLMAHLKRVGVAEGDAVIFADLGYQGSVQDQIAPMLVERMGLQVAGRYLLLREGQQTGLDKRGLIDARHYDQRVLDSLFGPIAVLEQLCTIAQGSVVDYKFDGTPVRKVAGIKSAQSATRDRAQAGAVDFARRSKDVALPGDFEAWRIAAGASLARLLYLPTPEEVEVLLRFDHDVNLGTEALVPLVDSEAAVAGLRSRGLPYLMHANRIYIPGEIRGQGLSLNLSMLAWCRYGLEITTGDMAGFPMTLPVIIADAQGQTLTEIEAHPTHDGYYAMAVPMGAGRFTVGVQWGAVLECVQIESARVHIVESFGTKGDGLSVPATPVHDGMETLAPGLYRCTSLASLTMVPPPGLKRDVDVMLYIVFRPVVRRGEAADVRQAA